MSNELADRRSSLTAPRRRGLVTIGVAGVLVVLVGVVPTTSAGATSSATVRNFARGALLASLTDPAATSDDLFGFTSAVAGTTTVVGAPQTKSFAEQPTYT